MPIFNFEMLKLAREERGLSQKAFASHGEFPKAQLTTSRKH